MYAPSTWASGDLISAVKANNWETQYQEISDGWIDNSSETWTYASTVSFTISGDKSTKYIKGHRVRLVQTSTKYFYNINTTYSTVTDNTTVTLAAGSDYALSTGAITAPSHSPMDVPYGFPGWFNWTPTVTGFSTAPTNSVYRFKINDNSITTVIRQAAVGASNANTFTISAPVKASSAITNGAWINPVAAEVTGVADANSFMAILSTNNTLLQIFKEGSASGWSTAGTKRVNGQLIYEF